MFTVRSVSDHAFLTQKQAIIVVLIAALAGVAGAAIQRSSGPAITQAWIRIKGVELDETILGTKVRVVIRGVNLNKQSSPKGILLSSPIFTPFDMTSPFCPSFVRVLSCTCPNHYQTSRPTSLEMIGIFRRA